MDEKGVQVMTETGTMSAKGSIVTDCDSVVYRGNERDIFYFGYTNENRKYIFFPTRCRRSFASCVNETKIKFTVIMNYSISPYIWNFKRFNQ